MFRPTNLVALLSRPYESSFGYAYMSTIDQTLETQLDVRQRPKCGKIFQDTITGVSTSRYFTVPSVLHSLMHSTVSSNRDRFESCHPDHEKARNLPDFGLFLSTTCLVAVYWQQLAEKNGMKPGSKHEFPYTPARLVDNTDKPYVVYYAWDVQKKKKVRCRYRVQGNTPQ